MGADKEKEDEFLDRFIEDGTSLVVVPPTEKLVSKSSSAHHHHHLAKGEKALPPISPLRPRARRFQRSLSATIARVLGDTFESVAVQVRSALTEAGVHKADEVTSDSDLSQLSDEELDTLLNSLMASMDLSTMDDMIDATRGDLESMGRDSGRVALAQVGVLDNDELVDQVSERAVDYATQRSAALVGKRVLPDGTIIDNPDAKWSITETTRSSIRDTIAGGLRDNIGSDAIVSALETSYAFSPERADMVSRTEIAMANSDAAMSGYRSAAAVGVNVKKQWILGPEPCEICIGNADDGAIGLDDTFSSGDDNTPAHPNCECAVVAIVEE